MINIRMYEFNLDSLGDIDLISQTQYMKAAGVSKDYINKIFNNRAPMKLLTAKFIISLAYNIPVRDNEKMQELLEKHFKIVK